MGPTGRATTDYRVHVTSCRCQCVLRLHFAREWAACSARKPTRRARGAQHTASHRQPSTAGVCVGWAAAQVSRPASLATHE
eukprot:scaffold18099_cov112-Isochrysis_galbana.AAC.1